jgi:hypothetical protein
MFNLVSLFIEGDILEDMTSALSDKVRPGNRRVTGK